MSALLCSTPYLRELRRIALKNDELRDAGAYDRDGHWQCSSQLGAVSAGTLDGLMLPSPDWRLRDGMAAWYGLSHLPGGKDSLVMGHDGFYVAADPSLYLDSRSASGLVVINTKASRVIARTPATDAAAVLAVYRANPQGLDCSETRRAPLRVNAARGRRQRAESDAAPAPVDVAVGVAARRHGGGTACYARAGRPISSCGGYRRRGQLSDAVRRHQFIVAYQPIVDLETRRCVGAEALVRCKYHDRIVRPDHFIPLAEHRGLVQAITDQVLDTVLLELGDFLRRYDDYYVSVNLSAPDLTTHRFLDVLRPALAQQGVHARQVRIEATKHSFLDAAAAKEVISAFRAGLSRRRSRPRSSSAMRARRARNPMLPAHPPRRASPAALDRPPSGRI